MIHKLDKETIKRIVDLHQKQGLSFPILGERFGVSTSRINQIIKYHGKKQQKVSPTNTSLKNHIL
jgi:DNA-directed RNA polymerase specialized sigma subunit